MSCSGCIREALEDEYRKHVLWVRLNCYDEQLQGLDEVLQQWERRKKKKNI